VQGKRRISFGRPVHSLNVRVAIVEAALVQVCGGPIGKAERARN